MEYEGFMHSLGLGTMLVERDSDGLYKGVYYPESHARSLGRYDEAAPLETLDNGYELGSGEQRGRRTDGLRRMISQSNLGTVTRPTLTHHPSEARAGASERLVAPLALTQHLAQPMNRGL